MKKHLRVLLALVLVFCLAFAIVSCDNDESSSTSSSSSESSESSESSSSSAGNTSAEIDTTVKKIEIDYSNMTYCGMSLKNLSPLFDEQSTSDPLDSSAKYPSSYILPFDFDNDGDIDDDDYNSEFEITIDLQTKKHVDSVYLYYKSTGQQITIQTGTAFSYENTVEYTASEQSWNRVELNTDTRYINIIFKNAPSVPPYEIMVYGYDLGEEEEVTTATRTQNTFGYLLGVNGHSQANKAVEIECVNYYRDYKTWTFGYLKSAYPKAATTFVGDYHVSMKSLYNVLKKRGTESVPCFMFDLKGSPVHLEGSDKYSPESYVMYAEFVYQYTLRYGNNPANTADLVKTAAGNIPMINLDLVKWIEIGNEPNGEDSSGYTPYQLAAFTSASYDGHCGTMTAESGSGVGIKNADPNIKVAMSGLAGIQTRYIKAMVFWLENNRTDGELGIDAFNVHTYCRKTISYNGYSIEIGVSPEEADLAGSLKDLLDFRDSKYPDKEVWLTEFGWDTNQSYLTEGSAHAYGPYSGRQVQAMWLTRAYFILSSIGVDRAAMYMLRDVGAEDTSVGKYGTSGIVTSNGSEKKDAYYYLYTLKTHMSDMYFKEVLDSGNEDVWVYKFQEESGKTCYALWCPTSDNVRVEGYSLNVGSASSVTLVEMEYGQTAGVSTALTVTDGSVSVNVSECPILVIVE